ncbi:DNA-cytosine methyltransferase (EC 2.1.1.37) [Azospirillum endophyticum]
MGNSSSDKIAALMARVRAEIESRRLSHKDAAALIGVSKSTLDDHLRGEHVRSDSARKYENWLEGQHQRNNIFVLPTANQQLELEIPRDTLAPAPLRPRLVVDIFSGCGGLSLGFDLLDAGRQFRTILALDNQSAPIATLNRNAAALGHEERAVGRVVDLTEFLNENEFLAFYLQHAGEVLGDSALQAGLRTLCDGAFPLFLEEITRTDRVFIDALNAIRLTPEWAAACELLDPRALDQTSVLRFHDRLRLPRPSRKVVGLPPLLWSAPAPERSAGAMKRTKLDSTWETQAIAEWEGEAEVLAGRRDGDGRGQLTASTRRLGNFADFLATEAMTQVRDAWTEWRAHRYALRARLFCDEVFAKELRKLYSRVRVSVLVGGPPCQGFSRIGRGKIRSLRDARIHAQTDSEVGDARNRLFEQYVMVLGALRPDVFLFENVAHFRSVIHVDGSAFHATEVLAEAIDRVSQGEVKYEVAQDVIDASRHGVPQNRQRYFMAGVLTETERHSRDSVAATCLKLREEREAPLSLALAGLPTPGVVGGDVRASDIMNVQHTLEQSDADLHAYTRWIRQPRPGTNTAPPTVDAHACRAARSDDAAFFALLGPGKRWMDYRADQSGTIEQLKTVLDALLSLPESEIERIGKVAAAVGATMPNTSQLRQIRNSVDGALPLRLLLEHIGERLRAPHHLLAENYLAKRESNHGDWLARMDASRPSKTMTSHMGKDTYAYVHPLAPRTLSVREAARIQSFPDWFAFGDASLTDAFKMIGNAVPPMLSHEIATRVAHVLHRRELQMQPGAVMLPR